MTSNEEIRADILLEQLFSVVLEEAKSNRRFAEMLVAALPTQAVIRIEIGRKKSTKEKEQPVSLARLLNHEGEDALRSFLKKRNKPHLRAIVERQQIPLSGSALDGSIEILRDAIVEGVKVRIADRLAAAS